MFAIAYIFKVKVIKKKLTNNTGPRKLILPVVCRQFRGLCFLFIGLLEYLGYNTDYCQAYSFHFKPNLNVRLLEEQAIKI